MSVSKKEQLAAAQQATAAQLTVRLAQQTRSVGGNAQASGAAGNTVLGIPLSTVVVVAVVIAVVVYFRRR